MIRPDKINSYQHNEQARTALKFSLITSLFCRLRREEAPGDPGFSLQHVVAGYTPTVFIMRRSRRSSSAATCRRPRPRCHLPLEGAAGTVAGGCHLSAHATCFASRRPATLDVRGLRRKPFVRNSFFRSQISWKS